MIDYPESFKDYPRSVKDARSDKTGEAKDWNPRDVLIDALRDIDSGKIVPDALMVVYRHRQADGTTGTGFSAASPDGYTTCALFDYGKRVFFGA